MARARKMGKRTGAKLKTAKHPKVIHALTNLITRHSPTYKLMRIVLDINKKNLQLFRFGPSHLLGLALCHLRYLFFRIQLLVQHSKHIRGHLF